MDDAFELDPLNLALEALMRLHAKVDYVIDLREGEIEDEEEDRF